MRVVIADDELLLRAGLTEVLVQKGFEVVGVAGECDELLHAAATLRPDLAIVDIRMPATRTSEDLGAAEELDRRWPDVALLILTDDAGAPHASRLLERRTHSIGYLLKRRVTDLDRFAETLQLVVRGGCAIDPEVVRALVAPRRVHGPLAVLTTRELEMLSLMAEGLSNRGLGRRLFLSERTVEAHVHRIFMKLDLPRAPDNNRRVLAVVKYLDAR